jgi:hypothetical protein
MRKALSQSLAHAQTEATIRFTFQPVKRRGDGPRYVHRLTRAHDWKNSRWTPPYSGSRLEEQQMNTAFRGLSPGWTAYEHSLTRAHDWKNSRWTPPYAGSRLLQSHDADSTARCQSPPFHYSLDKCDWLHLRPTEQTLRNDYAPLDHNVIITGLHRRNL